MNDISVRKRKQLYLGQEARVVVYFTSRCGNNPTLIRLWLAFIDEVTTPMPVIPITVPKGKTNPLHNNPKTRSKRMTLDEQPGTQERNYSLNPNHSRTSRAICTL
jgi:hypothetical protein